MKNDSARIEVMDAFLGLAEKASNKDKKALAERACFARLPGVVAALGHDYEEMCEKISKAHKNKMKRREAAAAGA